MPHALIVEDDADSLTALEQVVMREGFTTATASTLKQAQEILGESTVDLLITDIMLPDGSGMDLAKEVQAVGTTDVLLITGYATVGTAVEALRMTVLDYLTKPIDIQRLNVILANVARTRDLRAEINNLRGELRKLGRFGQMLGACDAMQRVYDLVTRVAATEATVLITGETGTGKDLTATTLHQLSRRRQGPFLAINCGAVSRDLIESELFGHERGSFTGAERTHRGFFERAHKGTLFLDEIGEMPLELQVKLLRVLECGTVTRIGGERQIPVDVRVIAATNRRPEDAVAAGKMREDLLYRLRVLQIQLPPLRERTEDLELLASHFLEELNRSERANKWFTRPAIQRMQGYSWPGNVRELKNVVHGAFILADDDIGTDALAGEVSGESTQGLAVEIRVGTSVAEAERRLLLATLHECRGDKKRAAEILGVSLKTLYNRLSAYKALDEHPMPVEEAAVAS
ncbi:MAG TPA: sigma-54 dependent transcriptional regulator [Candidatus Udaeobacter sp.]|nr:sigma-54 dependent transcriptional regulator [Candidatus Udaeobacter sp.]